MGTPSYIAPELTGCGTEGGYKGRPVDMWALGVVTYEMLHGRPPFYGATLDQLETRIRAVSHAPFDPAVSYGAKSLVLGLLCADPTKRLSAKMTLKQPWIKRRRHPDGGLVSLSGQVGAATPGSESRSRQQSACPVVNWL